MLRLTVAAIVLVGLAVFGQEEPRVFSPGVISDAHWQWRITFTPDGQAAYFSESAGFFPATRKATIYESHRRGDGWSEPVVAPFSGVHSDMDPFVTPDGRRLYFSSIRPASPAGGDVRGDLDIWMVERRASGWSEPRRLGDDVNSAADELYPSAAADGTLYFASGPLAPGPGVHWDIYRAAAASGGFAPREALGPAINTQPSPGDASPVAAWEFNPEISADGRTLLFASLRPGGHGLGDLYVSRFVNGAWTPARNIGAPVNTAADEYHPTFSPDGRQLYFIRRPGTHGDVFVVPIDAVAALRSVR